ncbi:MAG: TonB-dependent receptor domain-containing protein, partial [Bryobacteraceae bacterium]
GNVIPQAALDPAAKVLAHRAYAAPNTPGAAPTNISNFAANAPVPADADQFNARGDHIVSSKQRLMLRYSRWRADTPGLDPFRNGTQVVLDIFPDFRKTQQAVIEDVYMFSPTMVADFRYSFARFDYKRIPLTQGQDLTALGFSPNLQNAVPSEYRHIPNLTVAGMTLVFPGSIIFQAEDTHHIVANLSKVWSRHTAKFGVDFRVYRLNYLQSNDTSGAFAFDARFSALDPLRASGGAGFASFMLGYAASGVANTPAFLAQQRPYRAIYFQDDFRLNSRLTLNLGLRYDQEPGWTERYDRQSFFVPDAAHPLAQQTGLPLRGKVGLVNSPDRESRALADTFLGQFAPRFGFAYTATPRTVLRGGY